MGDVEAPTDGPPISALIFDIDDTMYPVSSGFSDHRNLEVMVSYMVERLDIPSREEALELRNEYFRRYHSSVKGLTVATEEGRLPKPFDKADCARYWAENCDFTKYLGSLESNAPFAEALRTLRDDAGLILAAFSNSPREYALRCLDEMGLREFFADDHIFGVEDVLPACKPERACYEKVLHAIGDVPFEQVVMFEDSMKNIRSCKSLGMHTVLIDETLGSADGGEAALLGDAPCPDDPSVDVVMRHIGEICEVLPGLWRRRFDQRAEAPGSKAAPA